MRPAPIAQLASRNDTARLVVVDSDDSARLTEQSPDSREGQGVSDVLSPDMEEFAADFHLRIDLDKGRAPFSHASLPLIGGTFMCPDSAPGISRLLLFVERLQGENSHKLVNGNPKWLPRFHAATERWAV